MYEGADSEFTKTQRFLLARTYTLTTKKKKNMSIIFNIGFDTDPFKSYIVDLLKKTVNFNSLNNVS